MNFTLGSGHRQEAVEQVKLAVQEDPLNLWYRTCLAICLIAAGRYDETESLLHQSRDLDPNYVLTHAYLAVLQIARQRFADALPFAEKALSLAPWYLTFVGLFAGLLVRTGEADRGR